MKRMLTRKEAALHCGLTEAGFEREVNAGHLPCPVKLDRHERWCIKALDKALDRLTGAEPTPDYIKDFEARYGPQAA